MNQIYSDIAKLQQEVRRLRGRLDRISIGGVVFPSGTVPVSTGGGGTGIFGSPLCVTVWENNSGSTKSQGAVVVSDSNRNFNVSSTPTDLFVIGVLDGSSESTSLDVLAGANGRVRHVGYQEVVDVFGLVDENDYLEVSASAGVAVSVGPTPGIGCFARALSANPGPYGGTVQAFLFPVILT